MWSNIGPILFFWNSKIICLIVYWILFLEFMVVHSWDIAQDSETALNFFSQRESEGNGEREEQEQEKARDQELLYTFNSIGSVKDYGDFSCWSEYILYYDMTVKLWR